MIQWTPSDAAVDRNALSMWFPLIERAGVPVPKTVLLEMDRSAEEAYLEPEAGRGDARPFHAAVKSAADSIGWPCFIRTDHTSAKHDWSRSCFLESADQIPRHIREIVDYSEMVDMIGLPWTRWAVRELLPTVSFGHCPRFKGMPIAREFRFFVDEGKVRCWHPYWPMKALEQGGAVFTDPSWQSRLFSMSVQEARALTAIVEIAGAACGGSWSVDVLETTRGWFVTDMAEAHRSYHWPDCEA